MSREAFEMLLMPHLPYIRGLVRSKLKRTDHADDLVQQALLRAFASRHQLQSRSRFRSWLGTIAINEVRQFLRAARPTVSLNESVNLEFADHGPSPFASYEREEMARRLRSSLAKLAAHDQVAIQLVDLKGLSYSEAASALTVSLPAFKSTHYRAMARLGQALRSNRTRLATLPRAA